MSMWPSLNFPESGRLSREAYQGLLTAGALVMVVVGA